LVVAAVVVVATRLPAVMEALVVAAAHLLT
jgi:hypothetical protein